MGNRQAYKTDGSADGDNDAGQEGSHGDNRQFQPVRLHAHRRRHVIPQQEHVKGAGQKHDEHQTHRQRDRGVFQFFPGSPVQGTHHPVGGGFHLVGTGFRVVDHEIGDGPEERRYRDARQHKLCGGDFIPNRGDL